MTTRMLDLTGQRFGTLTAMKPVYRRNNNWCWLSKCECGSVKVIRASYLSTGTVTTCGDRTAHPRIKGALNSYTAVHSAIQRIKGKASAHTCKCGEQAQHWAHRGCDHETFGARGTGAYCSVADPSCYAPLCASCHKFCDNLSLQLAHILGRA